MAKGQHVLLTGSPGVGKTTLVQKLIQEVTKKGLTVNGFFTQEIRDSGKRTGFQVVTVQGEKCTLASIHSKSGLKVGSYGVELAQFEVLALPTLAPNPTLNLLVIDEIGKMELFSNSFKMAVEQAFSQNNVLILATIPIQKGKGIPFVEKIRSLPNAKLFTVSKENRDNLLNSVLSTLCPNSQ